MQIKITTSHATSQGARSVGQIVDLPDAEATDLLNAKFAVALRTEAPKQTATAKPVKETATK